MAKVVIKNPYENTAYDWLSFPDDPDLGVFTPEAPQNEVMKRAGVILDRKLRSRDEVVQASKALGYPVRIEVDVFLRSTLSHSRDINDLAAHASQTLALPGIGLNWTEALEYHMDIPFAQSLEIRKAEVIELRSYDDPRGDLVAVSFDR